MTHKQASAAREISEQIRSPNGLSNFEQALLFAHRLHIVQLRKGTTIPYLSHLLAVASFVQEEGGSEDAVIAALLHDSAEDQGGIETLDVIRSMFGPAVADIVAGCSDTFETPKPPWEERKRAYLEHLKTAPDDVVLVSLADKLHNARSILRALREEGGEVWKRFNRGRDQQVDYYSSLAAIFLERRPGPLAEELAETVDAISAWAETPPGGD